MERISSVDPERAGYNRRGFLAAGAMAAIGGALLPARNALGLGAESGAAPTLERIFPLEGTEGDNLFVVGTGFDPEPENNWIVLGGGSARVEVVHAARNHLVGVIGPVVAAGHGAVHVFTGAAARPRETVTTRSGVQSVAVHRGLSHARPVAAPAETFHLLRRSPFTTDGDRASGLEIELGSGPVRAYRGARIDVWSSEGARHSIEVEIPSGSAEPEEFALHLADHLRRITPGAPLAPTARGTRLLIASTGLAGSLGTAEWLRIDLRATALSRRGPWFSSWSGRLA
jgi:hypothetical protein